MDMACLHAILAAFDFSQSSLIQSCRTQQRSATVGRPGVDGKDPSPASGVQKKRKRQREEAPAQAGKTHASTGMPFTDGKEGNNLPAYKDARFWFVLAAAMSMLSNNPAWFEPPSPNLLHPIALLLQHTAEGGDWLASSSTPAGEGGETEAKRAGIATAATSAGGKKAAKLTVAATAAGTASMAGATPAAAVNSGAGTKADSGLAAAVPPALQAWK